jgi:hypothetical protein
VSTARYALFLKGEQIKGLADQFHETNQIGGTELKTHRPHPERLTQKSKKAGNLRKSG